MDVECCWGVGCEFAEVVGEVSFSFMCCVFGVVFLNVVCVSL